MSFIKKAREAVRGEHLDGWLFFNFHGRDRLSNRFLGLDENALNSRPWFYVIPARGEPVKIVHAIEKTILKDVPGRTSIYSTRSRLTELLKPLAGTYAAQISENLTVISTLDHGTARYLEGMGYSLVSSAALIQKTVGVLDKEGIASHRRAATHLYSCIKDIWDRIRACETPLTEHTVREWIHEYFRNNDLVTEHPVLVAAGIHSSDPHYEVPARGGEITSGDVIQFDIWAKENRPGAVYADISWAGIMSKAVPSDVEKIFRLVTGARDQAVDFISRRLEEGQPVRGAEVDRKTRGYIEEAGYGSCFCHRTGHGIDVDVHGSGVNMDSIEFPDEREIIEGSCFSIEPGIYLEHFGIRSEINAYRYNNALVISGGPIQKKMLTL